MREIQMQGQHYATPNPAFEPGPPLSAVASTDLGERALRVVALKVAADMREVDTPSELVLKGADRYLAWLKAGDGE